MSRSEAILLSDRQRSSEDLDRKMKILRQERALQRHIDNAVNLIQDAISSFIVGESISHEVVVYTERVTDHPFFYLLLS